MAVPEISGGGDINPAEGPGSATGSIPSDLRDTGKSHIIRGGRIKRKKIPKGIM